MYVEALIDNRRAEFRVAFRQKGAGQHIEIARINDIGGGELVALCSRKTSAGEDLPDTLYESTIARLAEIDIVPGERAGIAAAHHETGDLKSVIQEALHTAAHGGISGIMTEKGNPGHPTHPVLPARGVMLRIRSTHPAIARSPGYSAEIRSTGSPRPVAFDGGTCTATVPFIPFGFGLALRLSPPQLKSEGFSSIW